jgi:hypothetical protein
VEKAILEDTSEDVEATSENGEMRSRRTQPKRPFLKEKSTATPERSIDAKA